MLCLGEQEQPTRNSLPLSQRHCRRHAALLLGAREKGACGQRQPLPPSKQGGARASSSTWRNLLQVQHISTLAFDLQYFGMTAFFKERAHAKSSVWIEPS